jgi:two-component system phosphate regulon sensor histidine kinase PhoR
MNNRFIRRLRYLFLPRGRVLVSPRKVFKAAAMLTIPVLTALAVLVLYDVFTLQQACLLVGVIYLVHIPLIWPYMANLSALIHYVELLGSDKRAAPPDLSFLNNMEELTSAVTGLQLSWEKRRNLLEAMVTESKILIDTLPDALIMLDDQHRVVRTNTPAKLLFTNQQIPLLNEPEVLAAIAEVEQTKHGKTIEYHLADQERDYLLRVERFPTYSPGGIALILVMHEVTEMKRTEQMFSDFVANASHEIRTPLASMMGFIETLQGPAKEDPNARDEFLKIMSEQAARMANLVKDLLSLSEIEKNVKTHPTAMVNLREIAEEVVRHANWSAKERGIQIVLHVETGLPEVIGDKNELFRVLTNLIINATKYGNANSTITVLAEVRPAVPPMGVAKAVAIAVQDEGEGISPEHLPRLTERFYRIDKARSRSIGGTGLGLAIVRRILDRHLGTMTIESTVNKGSTFTIYLPLAG